MPKPTEARQDELAGIREKIVIELMAADEEMTTEEATDFWARWKAELQKNPEHFGDCTSQPQSCNRCIIEDYYRQADQILSLTVSSGEGVCSECKGYKTIHLAGGDVDSGAGIGYICPTCNGTGQKQPKTLGEIIKEALK